MAFLLGVPVLDIVRVGHTLGQRLIEGIEVFTNSWKANGILLSPPFGKTLLVLVDISGKLTPSEVLVIQEEDFGSGTLLELAHLLLTIFNQLVSTCYGILPAQLGLEPRPHSPENVGCDYEIDSNALEDRCGVCHGNGSTCETVKKTFDKTEGLGDAGNGDPMPEQR
eukprot:g33920.t1